MNARWRSAWGFVLVVLVGGAMAAPASAQTYCVNFPVGCTGVTEPTVAAAMLAASITPERDLVRIGPGEIMEPSWNPSGQEIDIVGSGATQTTIRPLMGALLQVPSGGTLSDVAIIPDTSNGAGVQTSGAVTRIRVTANTSVDGVRLAAGGSITHSTIDLPTASGNVGIATLAGASQRLISDVQVTSGHGLLLTGPTVVHRVRVTAGGDAIRARDASVTLTNALVRLVNEPAFPIAQGLVADTGQFGDTAVLTAAHVTVIGSGRLAEDGVVAHGGAAGLPATVTLRDSIINGTTTPVHRNAELSQADVQVTSSAFAVGAVVSEGGFGGVLNVSSPSNTSLSPAFVNPAAGDYRLSSLSPLRDAGSLTPLDPAESATDLAGNPRILHAPGTCGVAGRRDMGAFEFVPAVVAVGTALPGNPAVAAPATFSAAGSCDPGSLAAPTFEWSFDDGTTATGATVAHAFATPGAHSATLTVRRASGGASTTTTVALFVRDVTAPKVVLTTAAVRLTKTGVARIGVRCPAIEQSGPCTGTLTLRTATRVPVVVNGRTLQRIITVGSVRFSVKRGQLKTVSIRISRAGRSLTAARGSLRLRVTAAAKDGAGNRRTVSRLMTLRPPR